MHPKTGANVVHARKQRDPKSANVSDLCLGTGENNRSDRLL